MMDDDYTAAELAEAGFTEAEVADLFADPGGPGNGAPDAGGLGPPGRIFKPVEPPPSLLVRALTGAAEVPLNLIGMDLELTPGGYDLFGFDGGKRGDFSSLMAGRGGTHPQGDVEFSLPVVGGVPLWASMGSPTVRVGREEVSAYGGAKGLWDYVTADPDAPLKDTGTQLAEADSEVVMDASGFFHRGGTGTDLAGKSGERVAADTKAGEIFTVAAPWVNPDAVPRGGGALEVAALVDQQAPVSSVQARSDVREVNRGDQGRRATHKDWPDVDFGGDNVSALPVKEAAPSVLSPAELPVAPPAAPSSFNRAFLGLGEEEGYDPFQSGFGGARTYFERQPVTAEGGGLMDLQRHAQNVAAQGRGGDTMLVHMRPDEVAGLASTGTVTRNPATGLPENFLGAGLGALLGGAFASGMPWWGSALATGAGAGLGQYAQSKYMGEDDPLRRGMMAGLTAGIGSAAIGGFGEAFGAKAFGPDVTPKATGVAYDKGAKIGGLGKGFESAGESARRAMAENLGTTSGIMGSIGGIAAESDAQQQLAKKGREGMPVSEGITYKGTQSYRDPRVADRRRTGLAQRDLRAYGFGPEQLFFDPRVRAEAGGLQGTGGDDFASRGIQALLEMQAENARGIQEGVDQRDPRYFDSLTTASTEGEESLASTIVDQAIAAIKGDHPQGETAVNNFIEEFGEEAFVRLRSLILQELRAEEMAGDHGLLEGSDGGRDDLRRGKIDGVQDINVSSGEYLVSADDMAFAGDGNPKAGARRYDMARKKIREKATGTEKRPNYVGEEGVEEVFDEIMTA